MAEIDVDFEFQRSGQIYTVTVGPDATLSDMKEYFIDQHNLPASTSMGFIYQDNLYEKMNEAFGDIIRRGDHKFKVVIDHEIIIFNQKRREENPHETTPGLEPKIKIASNNFMKITCTNYKTRQNFSIRFDQGMTYGQLNDALATSVNANIQFVRQNGNPVNFNSSAALQNQDPIYFIERQLTGQQQPQPFEQLPQVPQGTHIMILFTVSDFKTIQREIPVPKSETLQNIKQMLFEQFQLNSAGTSLDFFYPDGTQVSPDELKLAVQKLAQKRNIEKINVKITYPGGTK